MTSRQDRQDRQDYCRGSPTTPFKTSYSRLEHHDQNSSYHDDSRHQEKLVENKFNGTPNRLPH